MKIKIKCLGCQNDIGADNHSVEHIILNSLGGRLKANNVFCRKCNSKFGDSVDSYIYNHFHFFCTALEISRERGKNRTVNFTDTKSRRKYVIEPRSFSSKILPVVDRHVDGNVVKYKFETSNMEDGYKILNKIREKYKIIESIEDLLATGTFSFNRKGGDLYEYYCPKIQMFSDEVLKYISKSCIAYAVSLGVKVSQSDMLLNYLRSGDLPMTNMPIGMPDGDVIKFPNGVDDGRSLSHAIALLKPKNSNYSTVYISIFNYFEYICCISCEADLLDINQFYVYDIVADHHRVGSDIFWLDIDVEKIFKKRVINQERLQKRFNAVSYWVKNKVELIETRAMHVAVRKYFELIDGGYSSLTAKEKAQEEGKKYAIKYNIILDIYIQ